MITQFTMLNSSWNSGYKQLAYKTPFSDCQICDHPVSTIAVDFRSRLFQYIRLVYINRPIEHKISCMYNILFNNNINQEKLHVFNNALRYTQKEVKTLNIPNCVYIFGSKHTCQFRKPIRKYRVTKRKLQWTKLQELLQQFSQNLFNLDILIECSNAFDGYLLCCLDQLAQLYINNPLVSQLTIITPDSNDYYESDRLAAKFQTVLSYDFDCITLFNAKMMITNVYNKWFEYVTFNDIMKMFKSCTKEELIYKCCLLGTDYNLGWKGIGPYKVTKIEKNKLFLLFQSCLQLQSINIDQLLAFFSNVL